MDIRACLKFHRLGKTENFILAGGSPIRVHLVQNKICSIMKFKQTLKRTIG